MHFQLIAEILAPSNFFVSKRFARSTELIQITAICQQLFRRVKEMIKESIAGKTI